MENQGLTSVVADLIGLPGWLPKTTLRAAGLVLLAIFVISPTTFQRGLTVFVERETDAVMDRMEPLLDTTVPQAPASQELRSRSASGGEVP